MAQPQVICGLGIEANLSSGQLSLHDYRKFLSRSDDIIAMPEAPRRRLKRKPATINLNQAQQYQHSQPKYQQNQPQYHSQEFALSFNSPISSAPSSPPPLSFCQSVVTLHGDLPTPISPSSLSSTVRPFSRPSSTRSSVSRRIESFSSRLNQPKTEQTKSSSHHRASSDSILLGIDTSNPTVNHNGTSFEILNPRKSFEGSRIVPPQSVRSSAQSGVAMDQENSDHQHRSSAMSKQLPSLLLDDMVRPISASESAILSKSHTTSSPPVLRLEDGADSQFAALPSVKEEIHVASRPATPRPPPKTPTHMLRQKVSRLFGSSEKEKKKRNSQKSEIKLRDIFLPDKSSEKESSFDKTPYAESYELSITESRKSAAYGEGNTDEREDFDQKPVTSLSIDTSEFLLGNEGFLSLTDEYDRGIGEENPHFMSGALRLVPSTDSEISAVDIPTKRWDAENAAPARAVADDEAKIDDSPETTPWRRAVYGSHSSNRHHTLDDALRQLNTSQNGVTYDDITRYLRSQCEDTELAGSDDLHTRVEKPWQPETWAKPETFPVRPLYSRPSDGELSTVAPSTRPSIRPYARQAAAFMEGRDVDSASVTTVDTAATEADGSEVVEEVAGERETEKRVEDVPEIVTPPKSEPTRTMNRTISYRARPLSSNPPDLDTPLFLASTKSSSSASSTYTIENAQHTTTERKNSNGSTTTSCAEAVAVAAGPAPTVLLPSTPGAPTSRGGGGISWGTDITERGRQHHDTKEHPVRTMSPSPRAAAASSSSARARGKGASSGKKVKKKRTSEKLGEKKASGCCCS